MLRSLPSLLAALLGLPLLSAPLTAQQGSPPDTVVFEVDALVVTATRDTRPISVTPRPVSVVRELELFRLAPNSVSDIFRTLPGLEVTGVGVNQARPSIRGQRGQRLLLLEDGIRMNNTRRQQDFGEIPALVDISSVERVEVVRGPASVLYGSDAIGGVINIITRLPAQDSFSGEASYRYGSAEGQNRGTVRVSGRQGRLSYQLGGSLREASDYEAPPGTFGDITVARRVTVEGTGVEDRSFDARIGLDLGSRAHLFTKFESYQADDAGFGRVDPAAYAPDEAAVSITYPEQTFRKFTTGFRMEDLGTAFADRFELTGYTQTNDRLLELGLFASFGPGTPPGAGIRVDTRSDTDIDTWGFRAEARKLLGERLLLTYGVDGFRDRTEGTDQTTTTIVGFGPPMSDVSNRPQIPTSEFFSVGTFVQGEVELRDRVTLIGGVRYQTTDAETFETPELNNDPIKDGDNTTVGALNAIVRVTDELRLIGAVGSAFRSANLVERFFDGPTPEGSGYQARNEDLVAEKSFNVDLGARYRKGLVSLEGFWFRNRVEDGIALAPVLDAQGNPVEIQGLDAFTNVNIDELIYTGFELSGQVDLPAGFDASATWSKLESEDANDPETPVGDSFSSSFTTGLGWTSQDGRFWGRWQIRHNGERSDVTIIDNPIGPTLPAFTVQNLRFGGEVMQVGTTTHQIVFAVTNLTNELYAEATNATFFRPEARRNLSLTYRVGF